MTDVKLTDFSREELKTLHIAIDMYMIHCGHVVTDKEKEILDLWRVQILNASAHVKLSDNVKYN